MSPVEKHGRYHLPDELRARQMFANIKKIKALRLGYGFSVMGPVLLAVQESSTWRKSVSHVAFTLWKCARPARTCFLSWSDLLKRVRAA
jgi:hypothetical protein